jgi:hypothetical protein
VISTGELYRDLGGDYLARRNPERQNQTPHFKQLEALGHIVTLETATSTATDAVAA